jgi:hypothetical protein
MSDIFRVKMRWDGFPGGPGYSVFHMRDFADGPMDQAAAVSAVSRIQQFSNDIRTWLPYQVTIKLPTEVEVLEDTTGQLINVLPVPALPTTIGTASATDRYASAVGAVITWRTGGIRNGRRIKGRTFCVPLAGNAYGNDGTLHADAMASFTTAATNLTNQTGTPDLGVYARPTGPGATDGIWHAVTSFSVPDMGAVLRSRRD